MKNKHFHIVLGEVVEITHGAAKTLIDAGLKVQRWTRSDFHLGRWPEGTFLQKRRGELLVEEGEALQ